MTLRYQGNDACLGRRWDMSSLVFATNHKQSATGLPKLSLEAPW